MNIMKRIERFYDTVGYSAVIISIDDFFGIHSFRFSTKENVKRNILYLAKSERSEYYKGI